MQQSYYIFIRNKFKIARNITKLALAAEALYVFIQAHPFVNNLVSKLILVLFSKDKTKGLCPREE